MRFMSREWNEQHKLLRKTLANAETRYQFYPLFDTLHKRVHPSTPDDLPLTYADLLWNEFSEPELRIIPPGMDHSAAWCIWHITRIEDVVMNILVADTPQIFYEEGWFDRIGTRFFAIGNEMAPDEIAEFSQSVDLANLHAYWCTVTRRTRAVASTIQPESLPAQTSSVRLQKLWDMAILSETTRSVNDYWQSLSIAGLLLMPPTRHQLIHLNEMKKISHRLKKN